MSLAIFDLDNTLIADDSDHLWGQFLVQQGLVDAELYEARNHQFYEDYRQGRLDIDAYLKFALSFLAQHPVEQLHGWREQFLSEVVEPLILPAAVDLLRQHQDRNDTLLVITATNRFVTEPIVQRLGIPNLLATEPLMADGRYTGDYRHPPCYRQGKVENLHHWLETHRLTLAGATFYSDSHNDVPLLEEVPHPVAVDPDQQLADAAKARGWPIISLRSENIDAVPAAM